MGKAKAMKVMAESHKETVAELEEHLRIANQYVEREREVNSKVKQQNKYYRHVLGFYADEENYKPFGDIMRGHIVVMIHQDNGIKAREALEGDPHES